MASNPTDQRTDDITNEEAQHEDGSDGEGREDDSASKGLYLSYSKQISIFQTLIERQSYSNL